MINSNDKHQATRAQVVGVVALYTVSALVMVMVNKWVLNSSTLPLTFLFAQLVLAVALIQLCALLGLFAIPKHDPALVKAILAVVVVNVTGLVFNTLCLKLVDASYFQVARGLVLPLTILLASLLLRQVPPLSTMACCALVTSGFLYGLQPRAASPTNDAANTRLGIVYGVASALMIAVHAILVKWSMRKVDIKDMDATYVVNLAYLTNLMSAGMLFPALIFTGEVFQWPALITNESGQLFTFLWGSAVSGFFGFIICMAGLLSITVTSPVTHMFSSAVRSVLQTVLGMAIFADVLTVPRAVSIALILVGSSAYAYVKATQGPPGGGGARPPPSASSNGSGGGGGETAEQALSRAENGKGGGGGIELDAVEGRGEGEKDGLLTRELADDEEEVGLASPTSSSSSGSGGKTRA